MTATASSERAGFREWCGLAVLALPLLVLAMDVSVLYLASSETAGELAVALSVAVAGTVLAAVYRVHVDGALPTGLAPDAVGTVRDGLAPATAVAGDLPAPVGVQVLDVARAGFTEGFTAVGFVAAGMLACVVAVALAVLRER